MKNNSSPKVKNVQPETDNWLAQNSKFLKEKLKKFISRKNGRKADSGLAQSAWESQKLSEGLGEFSLYPRGPKLAQNTVSPPSTINGGECFSTKQNWRTVGA
jgi:hypothetical protein